jgi:hypothetical protein
VRAIKTLIYALIALSAVHLIDRTTHLRAVEFLLHLAGWGGYLPLAIAIACGITNDRAALIATVIITVLVAIPGSITGVADALVPIGVGIVIGSLLHHAIKETKDHGEPVHDQHQ